MYTAWIRIDETLPWIELKREYPTRREAREAAIETLQKVKIKVVNLPEKTVPVKALVLVRTRR